MTGESAGVRLSIPAEVEAIDRACGELRAGILADLNSADRFAVELLVREALSNAVFHGARQRRSKGIQFEMRRVAGGVVIRVSDGGEGFDWRSGSKSREQPKEEYGRGLEILHRYASRVQFFGNGNEVELTKMFSKGPAI